MKTLTVTSPQDNHEPRKSTAQIQAEIDFMRAMYQRRCDHDNRSFWPLIVSFAISGLVFFGIVAAGYYLINH